MTDADGVVVWREPVLEEWIDYNGHLSEPYYVLVFGHATDEVMDAVGLGPAYREANDASLYTVEAHVRYLDEVSAGAALEVRSEVIGVTGKLLWIWHELWVDDRLRATVTAYLSFARQRPAARRLLVDPIPTGDAELDQVLSAYRTARTQAVAAMLAPDLARSGVVAGFTASAVVVELLITGVDGVARWWQDHPGASLDEVTDIASRLLWNGLPRLGR